MRNAENKHHEPTDFCNSASFDQGHVSELEAQGENNMHASTLGQQDRGCPLSDTMLTDHYSNNLANRGDHRFQVRDRPEFEDLLLSDQAVSFGAQSTQELSCHPGSAR